MGRRKLDRNDVDLICTWIEGQTVKVTWPAMQEAAPGVTGKSFSIPTLRHPLIVERYDDKNRRIALGLIEEEGELPSARQQTRQLRTRVQVLQAAYDELLVRNTTLLLNAVRMNCPLDELERELPPSKRPTREEHERQARTIEDRARSKIEKQMENERAMEAARAERKAKAKKADRETTKVTA